MTSHILYLFVCVRLFGGGGAGTRDFVSSSGSWAGCMFGLWVWEPSWHCQDSIGTSTQRTQLLLPTLHIFLFKKENSEKNAKTGTFCNIIWKIILFSLILWHVHLLRKPYLMVFLFFRFYAVFCTRPFLELLVVRALCVLFLNIYFFNMLSTCQRQQNRQKRAVFEDCWVFLGIIYIILTLYWWW